MSARSLWVCLILVAAQLGSTALAQGQQEVPTPGPYTTFPPLDVAVTNDELNLALTRVVLPARGELPLGDMHGPMLALVEDGALTADSGDVRTLEPTAAKTGENGGRALLWIPAETTAMLTAGDDGQTAVVILEFGTPLDQSAYADSSEVTPLGTETFQLKADRVSLDIQRLRIAHYATTDEWAMVQGRVLIIEDGALDLKVEDGRATIGRSYGSQETLVSAGAEGTPAAEADPAADPEADPEAGEAESPVATPPVPALNGTVTSLQAGDAALVSGDGEIVIQGAADPPTTVLVISLAASPAD